jgi:hypothetical protein
MKTADFFVVDFLLEVARKGERCPTSTEIGAALIRAGLRSSASHRVPDLARRGLFKVEIYGKNWRVVEIDGMRTMEPPFVGAPYRVIAKGTSSRPFRKAQAGPHRGGQSKAWKRLRCLMCRCEFTSAGPENRICDGCKRSSEWRSSANGSHVRQETR